MFLWIKGCIIFQIGLIESNILSSKKLVSSRDPGTKSTALMICANQCTNSVDLKIASVLLSNMEQDDVHALNSSGDNALMTVLKNAPSKEVDSFVELLMKYNVNLTTKNVQGNNVFHFAAEKNHVSFFMLFSGLPECAFVKNASLGFKIQSILRIL